MYVKHVVHYVIHEFEYDKHVTCSWLRWYIHYVVHNVDMHVVGYVKHVTDYVKHVVDNVKSVVDFVIHEFEYDKTCR